MITQDQIKNLAQLFQIDQFTIFREYLQLIFLSYLYQERQAGKIFFKGGNALRLLFNSPRFSEDLDFSTAYSEKQIIVLVKILQDKISRELPGFKTLPLYSGKEGIRFQLKYRSADFKYPFNIRLDFHQTKIIKNVVSSTLVTQFPIMIFPKIWHLSQRGILAEKLAALSTRCKGRDIFDTWFLLAKGANFKNLSLDKNKIVKNLSLFPQKSLSYDLGKFLPAGQRKIITGLKKELINSL